MDNLKENRFIIFPLELKYRLNYFGFYSDEMTKKAMDKIKEIKGKLLEKDNKIIPLNL